MMSMVGIADKYHHLEVVFGRLYPATDRAVVEIAGVVPPVDGCLLNRVVQCLH
jgi:hypothetical protein